MSIDTTMKPLHLLFSYPTIKKEKPIMPRSVELLEKKLQERGYELRTIPASYEVRQGEKTVKQATTYKDLSTFAKELTRDTSVRSFPDALNYMASNGLTFLAKVDTRNSEPTAYASFMSSDGKQFHFVNLRELVRFCNGEK